MKSPLLQTSAEIVTLPAPEELPPRASVAAQFRIPAPRDEIETDMGCTGSNFHDAAHRVRERYDSWLLELRSVHPDLGPAIEAKLHVLDSLCGEYFGALRAAREEQQAFEAEIVRHAGLTRDLRDIETKLRAAEAVAESELDAGELLRAANLKKVLPKQAAEIKTALAVSETALEQFRKAGWIEKVVRTRMVNHATSTPSPNCETELVKSLREIITPAVPN